MTSEELEAIKTAILDSTEAYVDARFERLPFVKTENGVISGKGTKKGNKVNVKGVEYDNVLSVGNIIFPNDCVVYIFVPNGQYNNMFIMGQLDDTPANIKGGTINIGDGSFYVDSDGRLSCQSIECLNNNFTIQAILTSAYKLYDVLKIEGDIADVEQEGNCNFYSGLGSFSFYNKVKMLEDTNFYGTVYDSSGGTVFTSDKNAKKDIEPLDIEKSANFVYSLSPSEYKFIDNDSNRSHHGFIAQEVKESMNDKDWGLYVDQVVSMDNPNLDENGNVLNEDGTINPTKGLRYEEFIADIVATCQYQKQQIDDLQKQVNELKQQIGGIENGYDYSDSVEG